MDLNYWPRRVLRAVYGLGSWHLGASVPDWSPEQVRAALSSSLRPKRGPVTVSWGMRYDCSRHRIMLGVTPVGLRGDHADLEMRQRDAGGTFIRVVQGPNMWVCIFMGTWLTFVLFYVFAGFVSLGISLLHSIEDGQIGNLGGGASAAVALAMFGVGRGMITLGRRSGTKQLQEVISVAVGSDQPIHWVVQG